MIVNIDPTIINKVKNAITPRWKDKIVWRLRIAYIRSSLFGSSEDIIKKDKKITATNGIISINTDGIELLPDKVNFVPIYFTPKNIKYNNIKNIDEIETKKIDWKMSLNMDWQRIQYNYMKKIIITTTDEKKICFAIFSNADFSLKDAISAANKQGEKDRIIEIISEKEKITNICNNSNIDVVFENGKQKEIIFTIGEQNVRSIEKLIQSKKIDSANNIFDSRDFFINYVVRSVKDAINEQNSNFFRNHNHDGQNKNPYSGYLFRLRDKNSSDIKIESDSNIIIVFAPKRAYLLIDNKDQRKYL